MEEKTQKLQQNIDDLKTKITQETEKAEQLKKRTKGKEKAGTQQMLLQVPIFLLLPKGKKLTLRNLIVHFYVLVH